MTVTFTPLAFTLALVLLFIPVCLWLSYHGYLCVFIGHNWSIDPPWSGKELQYRPHCHRCGYEPDDIAIVGSHDGEHRI